MNLFRSRNILTLCGVVGASLLATTAASAAQTNLITAHIDTTHRAALHGQRVTWAAPANDRGKVSASTPMTSLQLMLKRSPEKQAAFDALLAQQQDPASPNYRRWLTPTQIGERFGATQADIDAISAWLIGQGLSVQSVSNSRTSIRFSGSAADVGRAFGTELHWYAGRNAQARMAPNGDPRIPAALSNAVQGVLGLSEMRFEPQFHAGQTRTGGVSESQPSLTNCSSTPCSYYVTPGDFARIYGVLGATEMGWSGSGQSIAILGRARVSNADLQAFGDRLGITLPTPTVIVPPEGNDPGPAATSCSTTDQNDGYGTCDEPSDLVKDQGEATLDVTRASSVALGANIKLVVSKTVGNNDGLIDALEYSINEGLSVAPIISISFGSCEGLNSAAAANSLDQAFAQAAMQGQSVFVSSGDGGAGDCEDYFSAPVAGATRSTNIFCASGHVTCVGGTSFGVGTNNNQYWNSTSSSSTHYVSAKGYIPEGAWNQPLEADGTTTTVAGTGGGVSTFIAKPTWQVGTGVPGNQGRYVPDVSFDASTEYGYFGCMAASQASCVLGADNAGDGHFRFLAWGGTSASAPSMAGVAAMLNQKAGAAQGNLNPTLYSLAAAPANGVFHDITVASSGVTNCSVNTASLCNNSLPSPTSLTGGLAGYLVGDGYDPVTGLGSINVTNLLQHWSDAPASIAMNQRGLSGSWADPTTSSQGFVMQVDPDFYSAGTGLLFAGWYTFDVTAAGGQRWYTLQAQVSGTTPASAGIYSTTGGRFDSAQTATPTEVGRATLSFSDCMHGTLDYVFNDGSGSGSIPLTRLLSNTTCSPTGDSGTAAVPTLMSGAWADNSNSGQGLVFDMNAHDNVIFAGWYTFSPTGAPGGDATAQRWYTLQATFKPGTNTPNGVGIYESTGGTFNAAGGASIKQVGTGTLVFNTCTSATFAYSFTSGTNNGKNGTLDLTRLTPAPASCRAQ